MTQSYTDMAKNMDAHLAELDIDSFRAEDIGSLLNLKMQDSQSDGMLFSERVQQYLSMDSLDLDQEDEEEESNDDSMSIESLAKNCQANKEHYTLAFKDSISGSSTEDVSEALSSSSTASKKTSWNHLGHSHHSNNSNQR